MNLRVVTLCNNESADQLSFLRQSCLEQNLHLEVLGDGVNWTRNALKLRLLNGFLNASDDDDELIMVVDAFDVIVNGGPEEILARYQNFQADIVFSAEANYYFREPDLSLYYWWYYPRREKTIYHYLNSGTFVGTRRALKSLLSRISETYGVNYQDDDQLAEIRSDQYLYSRFYADYKLNAVETDFTMELDSYQELFGCSGGRMAASFWPRVSWIQDYLFFKYERRMLKTFWLKETQEHSRDLFYETRTKTFYNRKTATEPPVIHLPGTYHRFGFILHKLKTGSGFSGWDVLKPFAFVISMIAWIRSVFNYTYIRLVNSGQTGLQDIFPVVLDAGERAGSNMNLVEKLKKNIPFVYVFKKNESNFIPQIVSCLRNKRTGIIRSKKYSMPNLRAMGLYFRADVNVEGLFTEADTSWINDLEIVLILTSKISGQMLQELFIKHPSTTFIDISGARSFGKPFRSFPVDNPFTIK